MGGEQNWRVPTTAEDYFRNQQRRADIADRRPVVRKAADIVGPGIDATAIPITDFSDPLATYDGFFSAVAGTFGAPTNSEAYVGTVVSDAVLGGTQTFTGLTSKVTYQRTFQRNPADYSSLFWGGWVRLNNNGFQIGMLTPYVGVTAPDTNWLICNGSTFSGATYPALATLLGSTTLPDLRDRSVYGAGSAWGVLDTDGLSLANRTKNMKHDHDVDITSDGSHTHALHIIVINNLGTVTRSDGAGTAAHPAHNHGVDASEDPAGTHFHAGSKTHPDSLGGPVLRGVGMNWLVRALA